MPKSLLSTSPFSTFLVPIVATDNDIPGQIAAERAFSWGEATGLRRCDVGADRSRIFITHTAVEVHGKITLDNEPKTTR